MVRRDWPALVDQLTGGRGSTTVRGDIDSRIIQTLGKTGRPADVGAWPGPEPLRPRRNTTATCVGRAAVVLVRCANAPLPCAPIQVVVAWVSDAADDLDINALLCGPDGRVIDPEAMVFYNQPVGANGAVLTGPRVAVTTADETVAGFPLTGLSTEAAAVTAEIYRAMVLFPGCDRSSSSNPTAPARPGGLCS
ncbi:TerD family protein [Frankia gtarii]|uniref:TerD family protein n=1 Tax=Frankia gtarii TaxID=2950102 RepID=UPI0034D39357